MAIAHPDRRAARGGWGLEVGESMKADSGYPGDPTPHTDRQTDRVEAARPLTPGWLPSQLWPLWHFTCSIICPV